MRSRITKLMAAVAALGLTLGLGACEGRIPEPQAAPADVDQIPDLTEEQESKIRASILETLDQATQNMSGDGLSARVTGPMLDVRNSAITVGKATGGLDKTNTIPSDMMQTVIPVDSGWPRTVYTITTTTEDQQSQRLLVFTQDSPRQNYKLWGVARLFAGAQLPRFTVPEIGTQMGLPNDTGLVATPQEAVERYADVLQNGANSEFADQFADDSLRQTIASVAQTVQEGMERNNGTQDADVHCGAGRHQDHALERRRRSGGGADQLRMDPRRRRRSRIAARLGRGAGPVRRRHRHEHDEGHIRQHRGAVRAAGGFRGTDHGGRCGTQTD